MRIDKLLWFLRLAASRNLAQAWVEAAHFRLNGRRIEKPSAAVKAGDVLTVPLRNRVLVIQIAVLPERRGPPAEAQSCYHTLDERGANPIARTGHDQSFGDPLP